MYVNFKLPGWKVMFICPHLMIWGVWVSLGQVVNISAQYFVIYQTRFVAEVIICQASDICNPKFQYFQTVPVNLPCL